MTASQALHIALLDGIEGINSLRVTHIDVPIMASYVQKAFLGLHFSLLSDSGLPIYGSILGLQRIGEDKCIRHPLHSATQG